MRLYLVAALTANVIGEPSSYYYEETPLRPQLAPVLGRKPVLG